MFYDKMEQLAEKWHRGQVRKVRPGQIPPPYIVHPRAVVKTLLDWGEPEKSPAVGIAWGHDLLEDTEVPFEDIIAASDGTVASGIRLLTNAETDKRVYLDRVSRSGRRDVLLVKIADRIRNSCDYIDLAGHADAYGYLHEADCIFEAVAALPPDPVNQRALSAWRELDELLRANLPPETDPADPSDRV